MCGDFGAVIRPNANSSFSKDNGISPRLNELFEVVVVQLNVGHICQNVEVQRLVKRRQTANVDVRVEVHNLCGVDCGDVILLFFFLSAISLAIPGSYEMSETRHEGRAGLQRAPRDQFSNMTYTALA